LNHFTSGEIFEEPASEDLQLLMTSYSSGAQVFRSACLQERFTLGALAFRSALLQERFKLHYICFLCSLFCSYI